MTTSRSEVVICAYRVQKGKNDAFLGLLARHWPTLRKLGLATEEPLQVLRAAEHTPEVMSIWEAMGALVENRLGRTGMEFPHVQPVQLCPIVIRRRTSRRSTLSSAPSPTPSGARFFWS